MLDLLLAVLSASAAAGIRTALPLLAIGLVYGSSMWGNFPVLSLIAPPILLGILVSWSILELSVSKHLQGQRILQVVELLLSPLVGGMMSWAIASSEISDRWLTGLSSTVGSTGMDISPEKTSPMGNFCARCPLRLPSFVCLWRSAARRTDCLAATLASHSQCSSLAKLVCASGKPRRTASTSAA
jgi:Domain of unknown function (DUF4126)